MNLLGKTYLLFSFILGRAVIAPAQTTISVGRDSLLRRDMVFVREANPWLKTGNAASLTELNVSHISEARIGMTHETGGLCSYTTPQSVMTFGGEVESYYRITPRMVGYGRMKYDNISQKQIAGSVFINPYHQPFDILEDSLTNEGDAHMDHFKVTGALSYDILRNLSIGAKVDFSAANYAKYKDLRHGNSLTDIIFSAGMHGRPVSFLQLGANVLYLRMVEGVTFSIYGSEDKVYKSLIDYGIQTGETETFGGEGYTEKSTEHPFVSESTGGSIQFGAGSHIDGWSLVSELTYLSRQGYYGKDSPSSIVFNRHHGNIWHAHATLSNHREHNVNQLWLSAGLELLQNDATTYRTIVDKETSAHYYEYYPSVKMSDKRWTEAAIGYRGMYSVKGMMADWMVNGEIRYAERHQTMYLYPFSRRQKLSTTSLSASVLHNIMMWKGIIAVQGSFSYQWGNGDAYENIQLAKPSDKQPELSCMETYLYRDYASYCAPQYSLSFSARYSRTIGNTGCTAFISGSGTYNHINGSWAQWFEGRSRRTIQITLGTLF